MAKELIIDVNMEEEDDWGVTSYQGTMDGDPSISGNPLTIYELLVLCGLKKRAQVDNMGIVTKYIKKNPKTRVQSWNWFIKANPVVFKLHAATAEITRQYLSHFYSQRVVYVPQIGGLHNHKTVISAIGVSTGMLEETKEGSGIDTHGAGIAWDHGDREFNQTNSANPTFFFLKERKSLSTRQVLPAVAVLIDAGILPDGRMGFYENRKGKQFEIDNMHYDPKLYYDANKSAPNGVQYPEPMLECSGKSRRGWLKYFPKRDTKVKDFVQKAKMPNYTCLEMLEWYKKVAKGMDASARELIELYQEYQSKLFMSDEGGVPTSLYNKLEGTGIPSWQEYFNFQDERNPNTYQTMNDLELFAELIKSKKTEVIG